MSKVRFYRYVRYSLDQCVSGIFGLSISFNRQADILDPGYLYRCGRFPWLFELRPVQVEKNWICYRN